MKPKILLPWFCALGLGAGLASVYLSSRAKDAELARLREDAAQWQQARADLEQAQILAKDQTSQIADLKKDNAELLRLRSEVSQLRTEKQQLSKQVQTFQSEAARAQAQVAQSIQTGAQQLQKENQQLRTLVSIQAGQIGQRNSCINNLRQIDAAKQQWALEHNKTAEAVPTAQDITPYLMDNVIPVCPAGGTYTLYGLTNVPTCTIAGHSLQ